MQLSCCDWPCGRGERRLPLRVCGADVGLWVLRSWKECCGELCTLALGDPFGLADRRVAETQGLAPCAAISGQM